jgi:hypothetical protein
VSLETEDDAIERWQRWDREDRAKRAAHHRSRMRWWKHARDYLAMRRLVRDGLIQRKDAKPEQLPDHPPWSCDRNWWPRVVHWSRTRTS